MINCFPALLFFYQLVHEKILQHELVEKLQHVELQKINIHNKAIQWYKKTKEIIYKSTLFDVDRYFVGKDSTVFIGLFDARETELKKQVQKLVEQNDENSETRKLPLAKLILQPWIAGENVRACIGFKSLLVNLYIFWTDNLLSACIPTPFLSPKHSNWTQANGSEDSSWPYGHRLPSNPKTIK